MKSGSLLWFARHEARLAWRDVLSMLTAGRRERERRVLLGVLVFASFMHWVAYLALRGVSVAGIKADLPTLISVTAAMLLTGSALLSQAMENVTRVFYTRSDLELILSSPARVYTLFAVRIGAIGLSVSGMSLLVVGPFVDVLAWRGGLFWLSAYGAIFAISLFATALAVMLTVFLFRTAGPKRTRYIAQIVAAMIGGLFVVGLQLAAMFSTGTVSRTAFLQSPFVLAHAPAIASLFWWPARAAMGDGRALIALLIAAVLALLFVASTFAPRFADYVLAAGASQHRSIKRGRNRDFTVLIPAATLRRKELLLLMRDPWLISQSLMQLLYLLPPAVLLGRSFTFGGHPALVVVPALIMAAGQLAGGLTWLTISAEDAPDLVFTAPIPHASILRAKIEAVMECVAIVFAPFVAGLIFVAPVFAGVAVAGIALSALSAALIQLWFRSQAKRNQFRRRHTSSRIATFAEAFSSIVWAAAGAVAAAGSWLALIVALVAIGLLACVRAIAPAKHLSAAVHSFTITCRGTV